MLATQRILIAVLLLVAGSWITMMHAQQREQQATTPVSCQMYIDGQPVGMVPVNVQGQFDVEPPAPVPVKKKK